MRPIIDDRGRLFGWANLVDLFVVVLLVGLVALAFVRFVKPEGKQVPIHTTFRVQRIMDLSVAQFVPGKQVRDDAGNLIGTIQSVETTASPETPSDWQGNLKLHGSPIFKDVVVDIRGEGRSSSKDYTVGNLALRVGIFVQLITPGIEVKSQLTDVRAAK